MNPRIRWTVRRTGNGSFEGLVVLPESWRGLASSLARQQGLMTAPPVAQKLTAKPMAFKSTPAASPASALETAAKGAKALLSNPMVQAAMPPQVQAGIKALETASKIPGVKSLLSKLNPF